MERTYNVFVLLLLVFGILAPDCLGDSDESTQTHYVEYDETEYESSLVEIKSAYPAETGFSDKTYDETVKESVERKVISTAELPI